MSAGLSVGRVVAAFGRHVLVEDADGAPQRCALRGRRLRVVCGDRVSWRAGAGGGRGVVESVQPRRSVLARLDAAGREEPLAVNIDQLLVVCAARPSPSGGLVDRYLAAAELMGITATIVANKCELDTGALDPLLGELAAIGYPVVRTSVKTGAGLDALAATAAGRTSILVGQSGVGKSSLLNRLRPDLEAAVGALSAATGEGRHTTSAAMLHHLPGGGEIIDSPGVRDYAPHVARGRDLTLGYVEIAARADRCRFADCRHRAEPDCAVKRAVDAGDISARRFASYRAFIERQGA